MDRRDREKLTRIEELEREKTEYGDRLQILKEVINARITCKERLSLEPLSEDLVRRRLSQGEPAVRGDKLNFPFGTFFNYAGKLEQIFRKKGLVNGEPLDFGQYIDECDKSGLDPARIIEQFSVLGPVYHLIMTEALKPVFERCREFYEPLFDKSSWLQPYCYICGGEPDMARIEGDDNRRYLYCGLCDVSWYYLRLKCPFCGNEDQNKLVSLSIEGDPVYSVSACQACNRYLKVADARAAKSVCLLEIEALLSSHLDVAARGEGFS